jgi:SOS-response transcriptional repressors (RecA-mediated autopeptidases)
MNKPTKKQTALLKFIDEYTTANNVSPSYRDIQQALNLRSVSAVAEHINNCVAAGFLKKVPNTARSLEIIPIEDHKETIHLIQRKIIELNQQLTPKVNDDGEVEQISQTKQDSIRDDIMTLKAAGKILGLDL